MSYDNSCEDLARGFLNDDPSLTKAEIETHAPKLAQVIQDAVERYIECDIEAARDITKAVEKSQ